MANFYTALGLMSGTSMDGVDVSIIESDGNKEYSSILDRYFKYDLGLMQKLLKIRGKITNFNKLETYKKELISLEREVTLFQANAVIETIEISKSKVDLIGFHGQTIFHDPENKITKQLGDGKLLSQLTKKKVVYDFRQNDLKNGGQGAPLAPIFHNIMANKISKKFDLKFPIDILNIGGIANISRTVPEEELWNIKNLNAYDIGPGNCLIDEWIRKNSKNKYDNEGLLAKSGKIDELILNQALDNFNLNSHYEKSLDIKDFDIFFAKGLSLENGAATITDFTAKLITEGINHIHNKDNLETYTCIVCGGGRKNRYLLERIKKNFKKLDIYPSEKYEVNGDFIESQAFAYLAIRSLEGMPISFPSTTRCNVPTMGGVIIKNFS